MLRFHTTVPLLLAGLSLMACSGQPAGAPSASGAPAAGAAHAAADGQCPAGQSGSFSSKVRHIPVEGDPCVNTQGVTTRSAQ